LLPPALMPLISRANRYPGEPNPVAPTRWQRMTELSFVRLAAAGGDNFGLSARPVVNDLLA
jgi:hypothetical protein